MEGSIDAVHALLWLYRCAIVAGRTAGDSGRPPRFFIHGGARVAMPAYMRRRGFIPQAGANGGGGVDGGAGVAINPALPADPQANADADGNVIHHLLELLGGIVGAPLGQWRRHLNAAREPRLLAFIQLHHAHRRCWRHLSSHERARVAAAS